MTLVIFAIVGYELYNQLRTDAILDDAPATDQNITQQDTPYISPIDFDKIKKDNADIYAWIKIDDTCVNYPIVQRTNDNAYYLRRDFTGTFDWNGCIFTENYNSLTFNDKVTAVYGHNIKSGTMFGDLIKYSDKEYFDSHGSMTVYLPDCQKEYTLVAAVTFDNRHLLHYNDYNDSQQFDNLTYQLLNTRNLSTVIADDAKINSDDRLVILSTCYYNQKDKRFLVIWKQKEN